eukprot:5470035-Prorocentrum_lima.AAC.1
MTSSLVGSEMCIRDRLRDGDEACGLVIDDVHVEANATAGGRNRRVHGGMGRARGLLSPFSR